MHVHVRHPGGVFVHVASSWHPPLFVAQRSIAVHVTPSPAYPLLHAHENPAAPSTHVASAPQLLAPVAHSSSTDALHAVPSPSCPNALSPQHASRQSTPLKFTPHVEANPPLTPIQPVAIEASTVGVV